MNWRSLAFLLLLVGATPVASQVPPLPVGATLQQVERAYPRMSDVHIAKCDKDGDQHFSKIELICVQNVYKMMYENF